MNRLNRIQSCLLTALTLVATAAFATTTAAPESTSRPEASTSAPQARPTNSAALERAIFGGAASPRSTKITCTSTASCSPVGGTPVSCTGATCSGTANWVLCDGVYTFCTCNPDNISSCTDPVGFCECWTAAPVNGWGVCRQAHCL